MTTETLFRLRIPLQVLLLVFVLILAWFAVRRSQ